jgi:chromosome partitioning protein
MIVAIASQKGGVGKTTTSISLSAGLARRNKKILLVDIDSQANSSKVLLPDYQRLNKDETLHRTILERQPLAIHRSSIPNLDVVPAHILLSNTDIELTTAKDHREARLKRELDIVKDRYDHIFIDCPPALSWLTINAFTAADSVLIIVSPGYFELDSITQISKTIEEVRELFNSRLGVLGLLFTMSDPTVNSKVSFTVLRQNYANTLLETVIPKNTDIRNAHFNRQDVFGYNPNSQSARAYIRLIEELNL